MVQLTDSSKSGIMLANPLVNYSIDGVAVLPPHTLKCEENILSRSYRDLNGIMRKVIIRRIRKVYWIYKAIKREDAEKIWRIIQNKMENQHTDMFSVTTEFIGAGQITLRVYPGTPMTIQSIFGENNQVQMWESFEVHWIEKEGTQLNTPGSLPS